MKKFTKFIYVMLAFALITCMSMFNPAINWVEAAELHGGVTISTGNIKNTVKAGEDFLIPMPTVENASGSHKEYIEVTDRSGKTFTYERGAEYTGSYFNLYKDDEGTVATSANEVHFIQPAKLARGAYSVRYKVVDGDKTYYSNVYNVQVEGATYSWEMDEENTKKNIIPSVTASGTTYKLPLPKILDNDDDVVDNYGDSTKYATAEAIANIIEIRKDDVKLTVNTDSEFRFEDGEVLFTPTLISGATSTEYSIRYKSTQPALADRVYDVTVESGYSNKATLEVTHGSIINTQISAITTFPTANVTDKTHNKSKIEVNTTITIKNSDGEVVKTLEPNQYEYTFTTSGRYNVYYTVVDAYGNEATSKGYEILVSDKAPYVIDYAKDYETTGTNWEDKVVTGVSYLIPTQIGYNGFWLPAIYAKDYKDNYSELKFQRKLELKGDSTKYYDLDKAGSGTAEGVDTVHGNGALTEKNTNFNKAVYFEFPEDDASVHAGKTYNLRYSVTDTNGNVVWATTYEIKIANVATDVYNTDKGLQIYFPRITTTLDAESTLEFTSASAKEQPKDEETVADARLEVRTYYYYGEKSVIETALTEYKAQFKTQNADYNEKYGYRFDDSADASIKGFYSYLDTKLGANKIYDLESKNGKTSITLTDFNKQPQATIFAVAINDQLQFVLDAQEITINDTTDDKAPTINSVAPKYSEQLAELNITTGMFNQHTVVKLPSVTFTDLSDNDLEVFVNCYVDTPDKTVNVIINKFAENGIDLATVDASYAGKYYVTYTAIDDAGNTTTYVSTFDVAKTAKAHLEVEYGDTTTKTVGDTISFSINLAGEGVYTNFTPKITWDVNPSGLGGDANSFRFDKEGTYTATISGTYKMNGQLVEDMTSVTVTIEVKNPTITWDDEVKKLVTTNRTSAVDEVVYLPVVYATENKDMIVATPKVVYKDADGKEIEVDLTLDEVTMERYYFTTSEDAIYTVTYTAAGKYSTSKNSFTITSGDHYKPVVNIASNKLQDSKLTYNGKDLTFKVNSFTQATENGSKVAGKYIMNVIISEGDNKISDYDITVTFKDKNKDLAMVDLTTTDYTITLTGDSVSSNGTRNWTIKGVGSYELAITVEDENGNVSNADTISFSVVGKTEPKKVSDNKVGIILIVVSAVILGGLILFFAFAGKRKGAKKFRATKVEDKKDNQ